MYANFNIDRVVLGIEELGTPEWPNDPDPSGIVVLHKLLSHRFCNKLVAELSHEQFTPCGDYGEVRQEFENFRLGFPCPSHPLVNAVGNDLQFAAQLNRRTRNWRPNDIAVQRYLPSHIGIAPHRDFLRDIYLVTILSLNGSSILRWHASKNDVEGTGAWIIEQGDVVLLRAPGYRTKDFYDNPVNPGDDRPIHSVSGPLTGKPRLSLAYRMNTDYITD